MKDWTKHPRLATVQNWKKLAPISIFISNNVIEHQLPSPSPSPPRPPQKKKKQKHAHNLTAWQIATQILFYFSLKSLVCTYTSKQSKNQKLAPIHSLLNSNNKAWWTSKSILQPPKKLAHNLKRMPNYKTTFFSKINVYLLQPYGLRKQALD